jgi:hypothetical protein
MENLTEAVEEFNTVEGVEANEPTEAYTDRFLVKVNEEDAVGRFYAKARELGLELTAVTRNSGLSHTVMDAFASFDEGE